MKRTFTWFLTGVTTPFSVQSKLSGRLCLKRSFLFPDFNFLERFFKCSWLKFKPVLCFWNSSKLMSANSVTLWNLVFVRTENKFLPISSSSLFQSIVILDSGEVVMKIFEFLMSMIGGNAKIWSRILQEKLFIFLSGLRFTDDKVIECGEPENKLDLLE